MELRNIYQERSRPKRTQFLLDLNPSPLGTPSPYGGGTVVGPRTVLVGSRVDHISEPPEWCPRDRPRTEGEDIKTLSRKGDTKNQNNRKEVYVTQIFSDRVYGTDLWREEQQNVSPSAETNAPSTCCRSCCVWSTPGPTSGRYSRPSPTGEKL